MQYKHTQIGTAMLVIFGLVFSLLVFTSISEPQESIWFAYIIVGVVALLFSSLTISVDDHEIKWFFGPKFWNKSLQLSAIESAKIIETKWYFGFGIRLISTGWLYNVSGLTAVELQLKDKTTITLGTNDSKCLLKAIERNLK